MGEHREEEEEEREESQGARLGELDGAAPQLRVE
jgi:hypothetical protein